LGKGLGTNRHGFSPYIGERGLEQLAKCEGHHLSTGFFCFVLFDVVFRGVGRGLQQGMVVEYIKVPHVKYLTK